MKRLANASMNALPGAVNRGAAGARSAAFTSTSRASTSRWPAQPCWPVLGAPPTASRGSPRSEPAARRAAAPSATTSASLGVQRFTRTGKQRFTRFMVDRRQLDERSGPQVGRRWARSSTLRPTSGPALLRPTCGPPAAHFGPPRSHTSLVAGRAKRDAGGFPLIICYIF